LAFSSSVPFIQELHGFFHRSAGYDPNMRRVMEMAHDGQANIFSGIWRKQSNHKGYPLFRAQIHNFAEMRRYASRHGDEPTQISQQAESRLHVDQE
jgi:hypothetical protein